jgi:hypothetical protein
MQRSLWHYKTPLSNFKAIAIEITKPFITTCLEVNGVLSKRNSLGDADLVFFFYVKINKIFLFLKFIFLKKID